MEPFTMEIAGLAVCVQPLFLSTKEYCRAYLTDKEAAFFVQVTQADLLFEQAMLDKEAEEEGLKRRKFTDPFLERTAIQRRVAEYLLDRNTLLLHGSTVAVDGKAYLFTAPCGTGKSTHTRLWRELFGDRAVMVNDDKPFLKITPEGVLAYGSPWSGKHGLATNICVPLEGICSLKRAQKNQIRRIEPEQMIELLYHQAHMPAEEAVLQKAYTLVDQLVQQVPLWEIECNKDTEAAKVAYQAMGKDENLKPCASFDSVL